MAVHEIDKAYDDLIEKRIKSSKWNGSTARSVIKRIREERVNSFFSFLSYLVPIALTALVIIMFMMDQRKSDADLKDIGNISGNNSLEFPELNGVVSDEVDSLVHYTSYIK